VAGRPAAGSLNWLARREGKESTSLQQFVFDVCILGDFIDTIFQGMVLRIVLYC